MVDQLREAARIVAVPQALAAGVGLALEVPSKSLMDFLLLLLSRNIALPHNLQKREVEESALVSEAETPAQDSLPFVSSPAQDSNDGFSPEQVTYKEQLLVEKLQQAVATRRNENL